MSVRQAHYNVCVVEREHYGEAMSLPDEIYTPPDGPPQGPPPDPAIFRALGVEGITRMLEDFYLALGASPHPLKVWGEGPRPT